MTIDNKPMRTEAFRHDSPEHSRPLMRRYRITGGSSRQLQGRIKALVFSFLSWFRPALARLRIVERSIEVILIKQPIVSTSVTSWLSLKERR